MGSLSDFFRYMETHPDDMDTIYLKMFHVTVSREHKKIRKELKLYANNVKKGK